MYTRGRGGSVNVEGRGGYCGGRGTGRGTDRGGGRSGSLLGNPENWICTCGYTNFSQRTQCNKCELPRSQPQPAASGSASTTKTGAQRSILTLRDTGINDFNRWIDAPAPGTRGRTGSRPDWYVSKPPWNCPDPECNACNWGNHTRCEKCGLCYPEFD